MATYLPGVTDYIPQIQPFTPDYNFYAQSLQFSQGKADAARNQLSTIYGSLLNAPLTREDNAEARDKFFKTIEQDIHKMGGMDLSLTQNSQAAKGVFNQLLDNDHIVKDMVWTKQFQSQQQRAQGFKNCVDPEKCGGGWWEGGDRLLGYNREAYKNATADEAMQFGNAEYVASQDITKKALDLAKAADLNVSIDQITGQWITTTKNGPAIVQPLQDLFMGSIAKDPKVKQYYEAQSELARKDFMYSNKEQYGSLEGAEQAYIAQATVGIDEMFARQERSVADQISNTEAKVKKLNKGIENAMPDKKSRLEQIRDEFTMVGNAYSSTLEEVKNTNGEIAVAQRNQKYSGGQVDRILSAVNMGSDINGLAQTLAHKDYSVTRKANPYGVEAASFKNRIAMEKLKHFNRMEEIAFKDELAGEAEKQISVGGYDANTPLGVDIVGGATINEMDRSTYANQNRTFNALDETRGGVRADLSYNEKKILTDVVTRTKKAAEYGDVQAKEDLVRIAEAYVTAMSTPEDVISNQGQSGGFQSKGSSNKTQETNSNIMQTALSKATTLDEKYALIKDREFSPNAIKGSQVDDMYQNVIKDMFDPGANASNPILREHLTSTWQETEPQRRNIYSKTEALRQYDSWLGGEAANVIDDMRTNPDYTPQMMDAMEAYVNTETGHMRTEKEFASILSGKDYSKEEIASMWGGDKRANWNDGSWWDATTNVLTSAADGFATTVAGTYGLGFIPSIWGDGYGFDYDSPNDVANWGGHQIENPDNVDGWFATRNDNNRYAKAGVHDEWKRAFTKYGKPDGNIASLMGAGDNVSKGQQYTVDPSAYRSVATMGTVGFLRDGLANGAVIDMGGFKGSVPEGMEDGEGQQIIQQILNDVINIKKGEKMPMLTSTYADVAGGDGSKVGLNIKVTNNQYLEKYKGSAKTPGLYGPYIDKLATEGITMYMDRDKTQNAFTLGTQKSALENLIDWTSDIKFESSPYTEDFTITRDKNTGSYKASGMVQGGLKEDGTPNWTYHDMDYPASQDLNTLVEDYDNWFNYKINVFNTANDKKFRLNN